MQRPHAQRPRQGERYGARNELHQNRTKVPTPLDRNFVKCRLNPLHASPYADTPLLESNYQERV